MQAWIAVAVGGALGSVARYGASRLVQQTWPALRFPVPTLAVNVLGCCAIGVLAGLAASGRLPMRAAWREFAFVGVVGGFTTFSAFALETMVLVRSGAVLLALANVVLQVVCGLAGVVAGFALVERLGAAR